MVASVEVFQVRPSASHSRAAWDAEETLFLGARPLPGRRAFFFFPLNFIFSLEQSEHAAECWVGTSVRADAACSGTAQEKGS